MSGTMVELGGAESARALDMDADELGAALPDSAPKAPLMRRELPEPPLQRRALCKRMQAGVATAKAHWKHCFDDMDRWALWARTGGDPTWKASGLYVANLMQQHVNTKTGRLYAKNPTVTVARRQTIDFAVWDGSLESLQLAMANPQQGAAVLMDVQRGQQRRQMMDSVARTLQVVARHQLDEVQPPIVLSMKQMVTRTNINGVGYIKLGYERKMQPAPETVAKTANLEARLANIERLQADLHDDESPTTEDDAEAEALRLAMQELQSAPLVVTAEGLRFDFPRSQAIIPDTKCTDLRGFVGCDMVTEEYSWTKAQVQEMFGVDLCQSVAGTAWAQGDEMPRASSEAGETAAGDGGDEPVVVWQTYNRKDGLVYWMVEGYPDFLSDPAPPPILLKRFWPWFALTFNAIDAVPDRKQAGPFPPSDIEMIRFMQDEYNRARQGLRDHRIAARPKWATGRGMLSSGTGDEMGDLERLTQADAHTVVELEGLAPGQKIEDVLQLIRHPGVDPNMYDVAPIFADMGRVTGMQGADMGATSGVTATEVSRAANAADSNTGSNIADMDMLLSELMREAGGVLLVEMDPETAKRIAGPGAVWPTIPSQDVFESIYLDIQAGSSGRPNAILELQKFERMAPILMQIPGIRPMWLAKEALRRMDETLDPADAVLEGLPSIMAMAQGGGVAPGPAGPRGPNAQDGAVQGGPQASGGADNSPRPPGAVSQPPANPSPESAATVAGRGGAAVPASLPPPRV